MAQKSADSPWPRPTAPNSGDRGPRSHDYHAANGGKDPHRQRSQYRDDGARALRAVFSSNDNWLNLPETQREEWRGYFDRMLERLRRLGYTSERNPCSMLLEDLTTGEGPSDEGAS